jgi:hypothetical protein
MYGDGTEATQNAVAPRKLRVFISYSRDDLDFAEQLDAALRLCGFDTSLDRHAISGGEEWQRRLGNLIREFCIVAVIGRVPHMCSGGRRVDLQRKANYPRDSAPAWRFQPTETAS